MVVFWTGAIIFIVVVIILPSIFRDKGTKQCLNCKKYSGKSYYDGYEYNGPPYFPICFKEDGFNTKKCINYSKESITLFLTPSVISALLLLYTIVFWLVKSAIIFMNSSN